MDWNAYREYRAKKYARAIQGLHVHGLGGQAIKQIANYLASQDIEANEELLEEIASLKDEVRRTRQDTAKEILQDFYDQTFEMKDPYNYDSEEQKEVIDRGDILCMARHFNVIFDDFEDEVNK